MKRKRFLINIPGQQTFFRIQTKRIGSTLLILLIFVCFTSKVLAQQQTEGIFLTADDFSKMKVSFPHCSTNKKYKFNSDEIFNTSHIKLTIGDSVIRLMKDSIFGYRDKRNFCYRFFNHVAYRILNPREKILLYSKTFLAGVPRNIHYVTNYYFSVNPDSPIYSLSLWNLKMVLKDDMAFHLLLNAYFSNDNELIEYDKLSNKYILNRIYEESKRSLVKLNN